MEGGRGELKLEVDSFSLVWERGVGTLEILLGFVLEKEDL